jgi:hypothetical protein
MFNHLDPAPFRERDLDPAAEQYSEEAVREIGFERNTRPLIHLPAAACEPEEARTLPASIAHYFEYRALRSQIELRRVLRQRRRFAAMARMPVQVQRASTRP